jgi:hypothetical protein
MGSRRRSQGGCSTNRSRSGRSLSGTTVCLDVAYQRTQLADLTRQTQLGTSSIEIARRALAAAPPIERARPPESFDPDRLDRAILRCEYRPKLRGLRGRTSFVTLRDYVADLIRLSERTLGFRLMLASSRSWPNVGSQLLGAPFAAIGTGRRVGHQPVSTGCA